jgi:hypothetical protein
MPMLGQRKKIRRDLTVRQNRGFAVAELSPFALH